MIGVSTVPVEFEEPDLQVAVPGCAEAIAAALLCGFRLVPAPDVNHEDVLVGIDRLQKLKETPNGKLRRLVRFDFLAAVRVVEGERLTVKAFLRKWDEDAALRRSIEAHPKWPRFRDGLRQKLSANRRAVLAEEGNRQCFGKLHGDPRTLLAFARMMEE